MKIFEREKEIRSENKITSLTNLTKAFNRLFPLDFYTLKILGLHLIDSLYAFVSIRYLYILTLTMKIKET